MKNDTGFSSELIAPLEVAFMQGRYRRVTDGNKRKKGKMRRPKADGARKEIKDPDRS
jgi:hypothetical protein